VIDTLQTGHRQTVDTRCRLAPPLADRIAGTVKTKDRETQQDVQRPRVRLVVGALLWATMMEDTHGLPPITRRTPFHSASKEVYHHAMT